MNAIGLALAGALVADEINSTGGIAAASTPDLEPHAEEQPHDAANATASSSIHTYRYATRPAQQTAPPAGDGLRQEGWS
ncbi:hypothetical protein [Streptomyces sp. NPDC090022]|uniref:hypothetical protein n=1 Tax=Streptomyces sp. NPDC090022 TaxID=3365920 RepID=UPI0037FCD2B3